MQCLENKIPPPLVALVSAAAMWGVSQWFTPSLSPVPVWYGMVSLLVVLGMIISIAGVIAFRQARTTVNPLRPESASVLVVSGIYQITRNPMYLGFVLFLCAWGVYLMVIWNVVWIIFYIYYITRFQILPEERALETIFGHEFVGYRHRVRRWL